MKRLNFYTILSVAILLSTFSHSMAQNLEMKTFGSDVNESGTAFYVDEVNNKLVLGSKDYKTWLFKLDNQDQIVWEKTFDLSIKASGFKYADGYLYLYGYFNGATVLGNIPLSAAGSSEAFVAKLDGTGNVIWAKQGNCGANASQSAMALSLDHDGNIYLAGLFFDQFSWGTKKLTCLGEADAFVAKFDSSGSFLWANSIGTENIDIVSDMLVNNGILVLAGYAQGAGCQFGTARSAITLPNTNQCGFIAGIDLMGNFIWAKNANFTGLSNTEVTPQNILKIGDYFYMGTPAWLGKYDVNGSTIWTKNLASEKIGFSGNDIYSTGSFYDSITIGTHVLKSKGVNDIYVAKYDSAGDVSWAVSLGGPSFDHSSSIGGYRDKVYLLGTFDGSITYNGSIVVNSKGGSDLFFAKTAGSVGLDKINGIEQAFSIYPNPVNGTELMVECKASTFELYDVTGRMLNTYHQCNRIDVSVLTPGVYFIRADDTIKKFIRN